MARLPDLDSLGARPIPRARMGVASVDNPGAIGNAVEGFGDVAARIGAAEVEKEDQLSYAAAKASLLKADAEARMELADDPDYETAEKRYQERMGKAKSAASTLIKSRFDRQVFDVDTRTDLDRGSFEIRKVATNKRQAAETATFASTLLDLQATARTATDDATREAAIKTATDAISGAQAKGLLSPEKALEARQGWTNEYVYGQAILALDKGDMDKARGVVEKFGAYLTTDNYLKLNEALNNENDAQAVMRAATAGMGKPIVSAPKDVPGLVTKLFPGARVTSTKRDPKSALGKANPGSHHNDRPGKGTEAIDVAPIEGATFEQYVESLRANGVDVVEARDEVRNPSKHATGPHWHVAYRIGTPPPDTLEDAISRGVAALGTNASARQVALTRSEIATRWQVMEGAERDREDNAVEGVQAALLKNGGNWYALPASVRASVPAKHVPGLINFAAGLQPNAVKRETNASEYVRLTEMAALNPKQFAALNPIEYRGSFDDTDWERLVSMRNEILGKPGEKAEGPSISEIRSVTGPMLDARGLTTTGIKTEQKNARQAMAARIYSFEKAIATDVAIWQRNNPGKKPSIREIQEMADRRLLTALQGDDTLFQFEWRDEAAVITMPSGQKQRVARLMRSVLGREPTDKEIATAYFREARGS